MNVLLGARIRSLRSARGYTQEQMADNLGVSRQKYARIENGTNSITLEILCGVARLLDVSVSDITRVLDEEPTALHRSGSGNTSVESILNMLDLFYSNKHVYEKLQRK